jgi:hypothetical protein
VRRLMVSKRARPLSSGMMKIATVVLVRCVHLDEDVKRTPNVLRCPSYIDP